MWRSFAFARRCQTHHYNAGAAAVAAAAIATTSTAFLFSYHPAVSNNVSAQCESSSPPPAKVFTKQEVAHRNGVGTNAETWVTYQGKVYDITHFVSEHPGGSYIRQAAGGALEPFWRYWAYHTALEAPIATLQRYEIGDLEEEEDDRVEEEDEIDDDDDDDVYQNDPDRQVCKRNGQLELLDQPYCSETHPSRLNSTFTPNGSFYVRNHAPVPIIDPSKHSLTVQQCGDENANDKEKMGSAKRELSLTDIQSRYQVITVPSVLQCAGNRGSEMIQIAPTAFSPTPFAKIRIGMMGNATWRGVRVRDVLLDMYPQLADEAETDDDDNKDDNLFRNHHVEFVGADEYATSIPLSRILDPTSDILLCWEMNGEPLPADHGFPLRLLVPGVAGARSVKWVTSATIRPTESDTCFTKTYYKDPYGKAILEMPIQSFVTSKEVVRDGKGGERAVLRASGVAWSGGNGSAIDKVEVRIDGNDEGSTGGGEWIEARLSEVPKLDASREWSWVRWEVEIALPSSATKAVVEAEDTALPQITCKATDHVGNTQPEKYWYPKGYLYNGWHRL